VNVTTLPLWDLTIDLKGMKWDNRDIGLNKASRIHIT
jgi:hypothetical protein